MYVTTAAALLMKGIVIWAAQGHDQEGARLILTAPVWPINAVVLMFYGLYRLIRMAAIGQ